MDLTTKSKQIDGEALLDSFKLSNTANFPLYIKSVWKDLSRRSDNSDKGFCKVIFSNYYELPGLISTRLFNLLDRDGDGYLSYSEFSKGMNSLFNSNLQDLMEFIFNLFDENKDGLINSEDVRTLFQYIPLQKTGLNEQSFQDRLQSQEELYEIISSFFKEKVKITLDEFKEFTTLENSTIFLYISVFLLSNKPFSDRTLAFYKQETKESTTPTSSNNLLRTDTAGKNPTYIASPNLHSKFSPSLKILHSPLMKKERDEMKKELITKFGIDQNKLYKNKTSSSTSGNATSFTELSKTRTAEHNLDSVSQTEMESIYLGTQELLSDKSLLCPTRQNRNLNDEVFNDKPREIEYFNNAEEALEALNSVIEKPVQDDITYEGYLIKLVDGKMKKLWFTLYEKYLYCKFINKS